MSQTPPLWPHQIKTIEKATPLNTFFDISDPGTGKTRCHITIASDRLATNVASSVLVICPKTLMASAWAADFYRFAPHLSISLAYAHNREQAFRALANVFITNTDAVKWLVKKTPAWFKHVFGHSPQLIIDESTAFKHRTSARSKAVRSISTYFPFRTLMTGTPITGTVTDLWHQVFILDQGATFGKSFSKFRNQVQTPIFNGGFTTWIDKPQVELVAASLIQDMSIRHDFNTVMTIPEHRIHTINFKLAAKTQEVYDSLEAEALHRFSDDSSVTALNAAVLRNKLLQVASGAVYNEAGDPVVIDKFRYELITDLIEERQEPTVVFFNWRHQKEQLMLCAAKRFPVAIIDGTTPIAIREQIVQDFQEGKYRAIYIHPLTGAHGLTLTKARTTIWASPRDEPDFVKQGIHRIYRGGQTQTTETLMIQATDTIEPSVYKKLGSKQKQMTSFLDILRETQKAKQ